MSDVVNDHFILSNLINDQIVANRKSSESDPACCLPYVRRSRDPSSRAFNPSDKTTCRHRIVRSYVRKNLIEIGERSAFISELHALR